MFLSKDFLFVRQRLLNLINRRHETQVIYMELRGVVLSWIMMKLFAVFYNIKVMNAEVFANGLEKCRLLTNLLGQNVENLDDHGCPQYQGLVKTDSSKQGFTAPRGKKSVWRMGYATFVNFCTFLLYLSLLPT